MSPVKILPPRQSRAKGLYDEQLQREQQERQLPRRAAAKRPDTNARALAPE